MIGLYLVYALFATLITVIVLGLLVATTDVFGTSIVGDYAEGYELGKEYGADDRRENYSYDSKCPDNTGLSWCTGYKIGYEVGWTAAGALEDN